MTSRIYLLDNIRGIAFLFMIIHKRTMFDLSIAQLLLFHVHELQWQIITPIP